MTSPSLSALSRLFAPSSAAEFRHRYWPARHAVGHGALERIEPLPELPLLRDPAGLIRSHQGLIKAIFFDLDGAPSELMVRPADAVALHRAGMTIALNHVEITLAPVRRWLDALCHELGCAPHRAQVNAYLSHMGPALPMHFDGHEVIVVQLAGRKLWRIAAPTVTAPAHNFVPGPGAATPLVAAYASADQLDAPAPEESIELRPGSALFLPRGTWHSTRGLEASLSLSFSFVTPPLAELVAAAVQQRLMREEQWRRPAIGLAGRNGNGPSSVAGTHDLLAALPASIGELDVADVLAVDAAGQHGIGDDVRAMRALRDRCEWIRRKPGLEVDVTGDGDRRTVAIARTDGQRVRELVVHPRVAALCAWVAAVTDRVPLDEMLGAGIALAEAQLLAVVDELTSAGLVQLERTDGTIVTASG